jgi:multicomponent Na+:H+ antiporter subunit E
MKNLVFFITVFILWLLLTWTINVQHLLVGVLLSFVTTLVFGSLFIKEPHKIFQLHRWFWFLCYVPFFVWECIKANFDVAYRVVHPLMPIKPGIVKVRTELKSDIAKTFLANSITLTPGTMTVAIEGEYLYIHWINVEAMDVEGASRRIVKVFEPLIKKIFD